MDSLSSVPKEHRITARLRGIVTAFGNNVSIDRWFLNPIAGDGRGTALPNQWTPSDGKDKVRANRGDTPKAGSETLRLIVIY